MARNFRTARTDLPNAVWDRLEADAKARNLTLGRHLRNLVVTRDNGRLRDNLGPGENRVSGNKKGQP